MRADPDLSPQAGRGDYRIRYEQEKLAERAGAIPVLSAVWSGLTTATRAAGPPRPVRRVRASDPAWPNAASWEGLNREVGGHLIGLPSPFVACADAVDSAACQEVLKNLKNPYFIGDLPGLTQTSGWVDAWRSAPAPAHVGCRLHGRARARPDDDRPAAGRTRRECVVGRRCGPSGLVDPWLPIPLAACRFTGAGSALPGSRNDKGD